MVPVAEPVSIVLRVAANHRDKGEGEQDHDQEDLATGQPELGLTVSSDGEDIQETGHRLVSGYWGRRAASGSELHWETGSRV